MPDVRSVPNPASNPDRLWVDDESTRIEARFLIAKLDGIQLSVLSALADGGFPREIDSVAAQSGASRDQVVRSVRRINQYAEALGFVPLVNEYPGKCLIVETARKIVKDAVASL